jgi:hypothetical protein
MVSSMICYNSTAYLTPMIRCPAHLKFGVDRVVIIDIDLHHGEPFNFPDFSHWIDRVRPGNGTQSLVWSINAEAERLELEDRARTAAAAEEGNLQPRDTKRRLKMFYGSLHDILSYPCEVGFPALQPDRRSHLVQGRRRIAGPSRFNQPSWRSWSVH